MEQLTATHHHALNRFPMTEIDSLYSELEDANQVIIDAANHLVNADVDFYSAAAYVWLHDYLERHQLADEVNHQVKNAKAASGKQGAPMYQGPTPITEHTTVEFHNPRELYDYEQYAARVLGPHADQYDTEAITKEFKDAINDKLREWGSDLSFVGAEIIGYALTEYSEPPADTVNRAVEAVDFWAIAERHDKIRDL